MTTFIVLASALLLLAGVFLIVVWGGESVRPPPTPYLSQQPLTRRKARSGALRRYLWWANLACFTAVVSGLLTAWGGGRLVMRILAVTSPHSAQGAVTEVQATVGSPTLQGTLELLLFAGLPVGFLAALIYLLVHRWLPSGRLAGPLAGLFGLLVFGAFVEPFRADNIDFAIVGPGWLSVLLFTTLAVLHGALVAAAAGWYSQRLPLLSRPRWKAYMPLVATVAFPPAAVLIGVGALIVVVWVAFVPIPRQWASRRYIGAGRAVLGLAVLSTLPVFVASVVSIISG